MRTEQRPKEGIASRNEFPVIGGHFYGAEVTCSDTIRPDSCVPLIPFWEERRQTEHAAQWSASIPCFRRPHSAIDFPFLIQPVAEVGDKRLRQLNRAGERPDKAGDKMANYCQDSFRLQVFSTAIRQTQEAASMAQPEVSKCR